jgi:tRNA-dihydrouridine synthase
MKHSKADGVMIGRGAQGKPWLLSQIASEIFNTKPPEIPSGKKLLSMISMHYTEMLNFYGERHGNKVARKHLGWYMDYMGVSSIDKRALQTETDPQKVLKMISLLSAEEPSKCQ